MPKNRPIQTIADQVYAILRKNICNGLYAPGYWLQEAELCEQLGVSRSPVREALLRLASSRSSPVRISTRSLICVCCWRVTASATAVPT